MSIYYNSNGETVRLAGELGRGGEGTVFELADDSEFVAKIYHEPITDDKAEKLRQMVALKSDKLLKLAAWVTDTLHDTPYGKIVGFLMPRVSSATAIHELYNPRSRRRYFPEADWRFLIAAAANLARAFSTVHAHGHTIGDVNHGNVVIARDATVRLIDCDSYHLNAPERSFLCEVGVSTHTPPELQGHSLRERERTTNHDNFGLAVLIFQLLFMGRHPFSGAFLGAGENTLEESIKNRRFAFGDDAETREMRQPPGSLPLAAVSSEVAALFKRAFLEIENRPTAREWIAALGAMSESLQECATNTGHYYLNNLAKCPWCQLEAKTGVMFFPARFTGNFGADGELDLYTLGQLIDAIKAPEVSQELAVINQNQLVTTANLPPSSKLRQTLTNYNTGLTAYLGVLGLAIVLLVAFVGYSFLFYVFQLAFGGFWLCWGIIKTLSKTASEETQLALDAAYQKWETFKEQSSKKTVLADFDRKRDELKTAIKEYSELPKLKNARVAELENERRQNMLEFYLSGFPIDESDIDGLGKMRLQTLQTNNIKTAADVTQLQFQTVPNIGKELRRRLFDWRGELEKQFVFKPSDNHKQTVQTQAENDIANIRFQLEARLRGGLPELQQIAANTNSRNRNLTEQAEVLRREVQQAESDSKRISDLQRNAIVWTIGVAVAAFGVGAPIRSMIYGEPPPARAVSATTNGSGSGSGAPAVTRPAAEKPDAVTPEKWGEAGELYEQGVQLLDDGKYKKAVAALEQAANLRPDIEPIRKRLAESYAALKLYDDALESYEAALKIDPNDRDSLCDSGAIYGKINRWELARDNYRRAASNDSPGSKTDPQLAANLRNAGRYEAAIDLMKYTIKSYPDYAEAHYELGATYAVINDYKNAKAEYTRLKSLDAALAQKLYEILPAKRNANNAPEIIENVPIVKMDASEPPPAPKTVTMPMRSAP